MFRVKAILLAFCVFAVCASQVYLKGINDGIASIDDQAFDAYVHFAKQMKPERHRLKPEPVRAVRVSSVWDACGAACGEGK